jgi:serine/threonine-protein phosphatase 2A regulatory subunit A|eukprot:scaffold3701_cov192-Alexandrium_tamarense.AAC.22
MNHRRVRNNLAKVFSTVTGSLGFKGAQHNAKQSEVFLLFSGLLQDNEAEVRAVAVENIARMAQLGGAELFQAHIAPLLPTLADDLVMEVRSKLAQTLMDCCDTSICNTLTDEIVLEEFRPLLENFLNDEFAEVQLHILTKLSRVSHLLGQMDVVVSSILQMAKAQNWRVREAVGRLLPHLAEARGVSFFEDHLLEPWLKIMADQVADVRSACVDGMPKLLSVSGSEWIQEQILPHYMRMYEETTTYLTRITVLRSFAALAEKDGENENNLSAPLMEQIVNILLKGLKDRVANVRLISARGLGIVTISGQCDEAMMNGMVVPALTECVTTEEDIDCKYQCQLALESKC